MPRFLAPKRLGALVLTLALLASAVPRAQAEPELGRSWNRDFFLENVASDFLDFWDETAGYPVVKRVQAFRDRFEPTHRKILDPELFATVDRKAFYEQTLPAFFADLTFHPQRLDELRSRRLLWQAAVPRLANRLQTCFAPGELSLNRPFVLGLDFGSTGTLVGALDGRNTLWLGVGPAEPDAPTDLPIAAAMFKLLRADILAKRSQKPTVGVGYTAYLEGAARYFASEQIDGFSDREAIGYTQSQWIAALSNQRDLVYEVLFHFESADPAIMRRYTSDHPGTELVPARVATFVGFLAMRRLRRQYSWDEIIRWDDVTLRSRISDALAVI